MEYDGSLISHNVTQQVKASRAGAIEGTWEVPILKQFCRYSASFTLDMLCWRYQLKIFLVKKQFLHFNQKNNLKYVFKFLVKFFMLKANICTLQGQSIKILCCHCCFHLTSQWYFSPRHEIKYSCVALDAQALPMAVSWRKKETASSSFSSAKFSGTTWHRFFQYFTPGCFLKP